VCVSAPASYFLIGEQMPDRLKRSWPIVTARESVWESRSLPALIKASLRNQIGLFLFAFKI
jgi:hypothetical protein